VFLVVEVKMFIINNMNEAEICVHMMRGYVKVVKDIEKSLRKYVDEYGDIRLDDHTVWGKREISKEHIELNTLGISVILEKIPTALKTNTSKIAIKAAVRSSDLPIKQTTDKILEDLKKTGSIIETKQVSYGEYNID
jgi:hypothetical protein